MYFEFIIVNIVINVQLPKILLLLATETNMACVTHMIINNSIQLTLPIGFWAEYTISVLWSVNVESTGVLIWSFSQCSKCSRTVHNARNFYFTRNINCLHDDDLIICVDNNYYYYCVNNNFPLIRQTVVMNYHDVWS